MLTTKREKNICNRYSQRDSNGKVHCNECPLTKGNFKAYDFRCKANSHYVRSTKEWKYDDREIAECLNEYIIR